MGLEQTSLAQALILALGGTVPGFGVAYALFYWSIGRKYGPIKGLSSHAKIKYWCGLTATIFFGLGISTVLNEIFSAYLHERELAFSIIERGVFTAIAPLLTTIALAFLLLKVRRDGIQTSQLHSGGVETNSARSGSTIKRSIVSFTVLAAIAITFAIIPLLNDYFRNSKDFLLTGCYSCDKESTCTSNNPPTEFRVDSSSVYLFFKLDEQNRIVKFPIDDEMKCIIVKERNFAFDCSSSKTSGDLLMKLTVTFDGEKSFQYDSTTHATVNGILLSRNKVTCVAK